MRSSVSRTSSAVTRSIRRTCSNAGTMATLATLASLTACGGGGYDGGKTQAGTLQFSASTFSVNESAGTATITVTRTNGSDNAVSATISSTNGSAIAGQDFTAAAATVSFAAGDATAKTFTIPIANDLDTENDETFTIALGGASGGSTVNVALAAVLLMP